MYCVKEKGIGLQGVELLDRMDKVESVLKCLEKKKILNLTVIRENTELPPGFNLEAVEAQLQLSEPVKMFVDLEGVSHISDEITPAQLFPVAMDYSDVIFLGTQQSTSHIPGKKLFGVQDDSDTDSHADSEGESEGDFYDMGEYKPGDHEKGVAEELELINALKKKKAIDPEREAILNELEKQKKAREDPFLNYEGDTDVEELYEEETGSECEDVAEPEYFKGKQIVVNPGPTSKAHHEPACKKNMDFRPSSDEDSSPGDLGDSDDDGFVPKHLFTSGRKSRSKKPKVRVWYDETRENPDDQLCKKMCFTDVYQYRRALRHLHVSQLRNFTYHRNNKDRVIAVCADDNCPFFMVGSQIKHENTFVLRKMNLQHECLAHGENTKVTIDWLAETSVGAMRTDFNTSVDTLIEQAKQKYGVVVPRSKAYRARTKALNIVLGEAGKFGTYTIISDRQKGLIKAVSKVFPNSPQRFCLRHISANFQQAGFRGPELKKHIDAASYSYTKSGFEQAMEALKVDCEEAYNWLAEIPVQTWARFAFDYNCKTDLVVNNLSEVFNKMILDVRSKPIWTMVDGIRSKLMVKYCGIRGKEDSTRWEITPFYCEKLEEAKKYSRYCTALAADKALGLWQVTSGDKIHPVNLIAKTCGCKKWDLTGIPCNHAISAMMKDKSHPEDYVLDFFKKPMYFEAYKHVVYPVPGPDAWTKTDTQDIDPPPTRPRPGRKQTKRRKGAFEVPVPKDTSRVGSITCKNCKKTGHRFSNCDIPLRPELKIRKAQHQANRHIFAEDTPGTSSAARAPRTAPQAPAKRTPAARPSTPRVPAPEPTTVTTSSAPAVPRAASVPSSSAPAAPRRAARAGASSSIGPTRSSKRKRTLTGRMKGYLTASGNY
ncbi:unnamed protein product [Alopecurus aequalis]